MSLALIDVKERLSPVMPAALYEKEAIVYLHINVHAFRKLVQAGKIPFTQHPGNSRKIFVKADLDFYLASLPRYTSEDPPNAMRKGVFHER